MGKTIRNSTQRTEHTTIHIILFNSEVTMATIKDIAQAAGVSPAAVSRILNNDPTLSV